MPKPTYYHLPAEKRETLLAAIRDELARVPCDEASINKIVHAAGIPRGSFYQYFSDKDDMLAAVLESYAASMGQYIETLLNGRCDAFALFSCCLRETVRYGSDAENGAFFRNIFAYLKVQKSGYLRSLPLDLPENALMEIWARLDKTGLAFPSQKDFVCLMGVLSACAKSTLAACFAHPDRVDNILAVYDRGMEIIKNGALLPVSEVG